MCRWLTINFRFIIRISPAEQSRWTEQIESRLGKRRTIDILLINSALWDINRWLSITCCIVADDFIHHRSGPWAHLDLRQNIEDFLSSIPLSVPNGLCFWLTTPPASYTALCVAVYIHPLWSSTCPGPWIQLNPSNFAKGVMQPAQLLPFLSLPTRSPDQSAF